MKNDATFVRMRSGDHLGHAKNVVKRHLAPSNLKRHSPHGAAFWRLDDDACGPDWTKTFLADFFDSLCFLEWTWPF